MSNELSPTTFSVGANETLAAVDVYTQQGTEVINGVKALNASAFGNLNPFKVIPLKTKIPIVGSSIYSLASAAAITPGLPTFVANNPFLSAGVAKLGPSSPLKAALNKGMDLKSTVMATVGNVSSIIQNANLGTLSGITDMVKGLTGTSLPISLKDISGLGKMGAGLVKEAAAQGLGGVFTAIANSPNFGSPLVNGIALSLVPSLIAKTNIPLLKEIAGSASAPYVKMYNPYLALQMAKNFKKDVIALKKEIKSLPSQIVAQKNALKGEWGDFKNAMKSGLDPKFLLSEKSGAVNTRIAGVVSKQAAQAISLSRGINSPNLAKLITSGETVSSKINLDSLLNITTKMIVANGPRTAPAWATGMRNILTSADSIGSSSAVNQTQEIAPAPPVVNNSSTSDQYLANLESEKAKAAWSDATFNDRLAAEIAVSKNGYSDIVIPPLTPPTTVAALRADYPTIVPSPIEQMKTDAASLSAGDWRQAALLKEADRLEQQRLMQIAVDAPVTGGYRSQLKFD
jgi:hypothetical protein